jgi:hypothetical protein
MRRIIAWLWAINLLASLAAPSLSWSNTEGPELLWAQYQEIRENLTDTAFDLPIFVRSKTQDDLLSTEVYGLVDQPFYALAEMLPDPTSWCEFIPLNFNIKSCTYQCQKGKVLLTFYAGRKFYQPPDKAFKLNYYFHVEDLNEKYFKALLKADKGPMGTRDYRIELEAMAVGKEALIRIRSSYRPSLRSKIATMAYLKTLGRDKVGFTILQLNEEDKPVYVKGVKGIIERNAMRYYLAIKAYIDTRHLRSEERFEGLLNSWFNRTERYHAQLHEMDKEEYMQAKRLERKNQLKLQKGLGRAGKNPACF